MPSKVGFYKVEVPMSPNLYAFFEKIAKRQHITTEEVMEKFLTFWAEKGFKYGHFDASINPFMSKYKLESIEKAKAKKQNNMQQNLISTD